MMDMEWITALMMFISFFMLALSGVPISFSIGLASLLSSFTLFPPHISLAILGQKVATGLDNFSLLAIPFFILTGILMNSGGVARRLVHFAQVLVGHVPGSMGHVNVIANMIFGSISGSAVAACAAVGGTMAPIQKKAGYPPEYSAAINITSCITGLLIPPSNVLIVYALTAGGLSVAALFMAGYLPGILMGLSIILVGAFFSKKRSYPVMPRATCRQVLQASWDALPSMLLVVIIIGGILGGFFTATEASAVSVVYTFILSVFIYQEIKLIQLPKILLSAVVMTSIVLLLVSVSFGMSWVMTDASIPETIADSLLSMSNNPIVVPMIINIILLVIGIFMDMTPAVLIFTPILLPIATRIGMDPVHFGIMMVSNLCIGLCTPPVGSALFIGCSVANLKVQQILRPMLPFFGALLCALMAITYIPQISLFLPKLLGL